MLFLLFQIGSDRYAIEAQSAVEVVPLLALKQIPQAAPGVAGIFNYRGRPVPAIDLCALTLGRPARAQLSTRIIILRHDSARGPQLVGVIAERATGLLRREAKEVGSTMLDGAPSFSRTESERSRSTSPIPRSTFLGPVLMDDKGFLQLVRPEHLLTEPVREALFAQVASFSYEGD